MKKYFVPGKVGNNILFIQEKINFYNNFICINHNFKVILHSVGVKMGAFKLTLRKWFVGTQTTA